MISEQNLFLANMVTSLKHELSFAKAELGKLTTQLQDGSGEITTQSQIVRSRDLQRQESKTISNFHSYKSSMVQADGQTCGACGRSLDIDKTLSIDDRASRIEILELELKELRYKNIEL